MRTGCRFHPAAVDARVTHSHTLHAPWVPLFSQFCLELATVLEAELSRVGNIGPGRQPMLSTQPQRAVSSANQLLGVPRYGIMGSMYRTSQISSLWHRIIVSFLLGFGLFALGVLVTTLLNESNVSGIVLYLDDVILGLIAGLLVFIYEQRRHRAMMDKVRVIAAMNHHVRNALQAITFAPYAEQSKQIQLIDMSAKRIQWALQEILPGEIEPPPRQTEYDNRDKEPRGT
jgi:hypothetical protein